MHIKETFISVFTRLGDFLSQFQENSGNNSPALESLNNNHYEDFRALIEDAHIYNPWFTPENVKRAITGIALMLEEDVLKKWLDAYTLSEPAEGTVRTVGLVLAGNIPLVGFHDMMCVLAAGHSILAKPSSKDDRLIRNMARIIGDIDPLFGKRIRITDEYLSGVDAVIATGSDNNARYFEYYFREIPHIIRKNRNGIAVLTGQETVEDLAGIGDDIFTYFGLGCRNVTKLYIPESYDLTILLEVLDCYQHLYQHHKYGNNVDYYRTIYLMNRIDFLDNGVLLLKEDPAIASPVGVVFYERYSEIGFVQQELELHRQEIQCIVSGNTEIDGAIQPGSTQIPMPWDYADGVDTIRFLMEL
ncbi:MAG: hypothetical protein KAT15_25265, partial [Bacteroidales bacterium]|nr:hypothetical protein [Bacteroidales bacterium]